MPELIVSGFHRSGTSLLTDLFHRAGLFVGDDLLGAMPSNPYGHFEDRDVLRIHDQILRDNGLNWQADRTFMPFIDKERWRSMQQLADRRRAHHPLWGFKDPRACFFLPAWKHVLPSMRTVIVYREPADSIASLFRRQTADLVEQQGNAESHRRFWAEPDLALRMWLAHNRALLGFAAAHPDDTMVVSFDALAKGYPIVERCNTQWNLALDPVTTAEVFDPAVTSGPSDSTLVFDESLIPDVRSILDTFDRLDVMKQSKEASVAL